MIITTCLMLWMPSAGVACASAGPSSPASSMLNTALRASVVSTRPRDVDAVLLSDDGIRSLLLTVHPSRSVQLSSGRLVAEVYTAIGASLLLKLRGIDVRHDRLKGRRFSLQAYR